MPKARLASLMLTACICLGLISLLAACNGGRTSFVEVASLRDNLPKLEVEAMAWQQDAYLEFAHLALLTGDFEPSPIIAQFVSPSNPQQSLLVSLGVDGEVTTEPVTQTTQQTLTKPISDRDWLLDSPEIIDRALNPQALQFLEDHADSQCSFMVLERDNTLADAPLYWRITINECVGDAGLPTIVLDPNTGEIVRTGPG